MRELIAPTNDKIGETKQLPAGDIAAGLQIKQAIIDMPKDMERFSLNIEKEKHNIDEYTNQLETEFPYQEELLTKRKRLVEVDGIIIAKAKEVAENKNVVTSLPTIEGEAKQTFGVKINY